MVHFNNYSTAPGNNLNFTGEGSSMEICDEKLH